MHSSGYCLRLYIHESHKHNKKLAYEWLLDQAAALGVAGGSVFRAIAGSRRESEPHDDDLMESIMDMTVMVEFILASREADALLALVKQARLPVFCTRMPVEFGELLV